LYESYFGLTERPFSIAPDPHYLYMSSRHKEAMAHLSYGLSQGGCFIVLTGEVGTGKTTLCRNLLNDLPSNVDVALILNANVNEAELLQTVCDELKISYQENSSQKQLLDLINKHLLKTFAENRHTVLIIDEAQILKRDVLEQIRLLTNLETTKSKLLQIILIGQPELYELLSRNDLRQLAQRVTARYHLGSLQRNEIEEYVNYRLSVAGCKQPLFSRQALNKMHDLSGGIPRKINVLADHALLSTYSQNKMVVDSPIVAKAAKEVFIVSKSDRSAKQALTQGYTKWVALAALVFLVNGLAWYIFSDNSTQPLVKESGVISGSVLEEPKPIANHNSNVLTQPATVGSEASNDASGLLGRDNVLQGELSVTESAAVQVVEDLPGLTAPGTVTVSDAYLTADSDVDEVVSSVNIVEPISSLNAGSQEVTSLGRILESSADLTGRIAAFRHLAMQWGVELPSQILKPVCQAATDQGLSCLSFKKWSSLQAFNRPAILVVEHQGKAHRVIVKSINDGVASILIASSTQQVSLSELRQRWTGAGVIFWRSTSPESFLKLGDNDVNVLVTRRKLNKALERAELPVLISLDSTAFDRDMLQKTLILQKAFGLNDDGRIGSETHLLLNELVNVEPTPLLVQRTSNPVL